MTPAFDFEALAVGFAGDDEQAHALSVTFDVFQDFVPCAAVDGPHEYICLWFHEPSLEHPPDGWRGIIGQKNRHAIAEGGRSPAWTGAANDHHPDPEGRV